MTAASVDELLEQVRLRRKLPSAAERRRIREAAGLSLRDVAAALGVSHTAVASWEAGATPREPRAAYARLLEGLRRIREGEIAIADVREAGFPASEPRADENVDGNRTEPV